MEKEIRIPWHFHRCDWCHYASKSVCVIHKHSDIHTRLELNPQGYHCTSNTPELYECELCDFHTDLEVTFSEHLRVIHGGKEDNDFLPRILECYECKNCCFMTYSLLVLLRHECEDIYQRLPSTEMPFKCEKCSYEAKRRENLQRHIVNKHTSSEEIKWNECEKCPYKAKLKAHLKRHILYKHTSSEEINWHECNKCSYKAKQKRNLNQHILSKHTSSDEIKWYECYQCLYRAKQKRNLERHILSRHGRPEDIDWFQCDQCSHKTKLKTHLKIHVLHKHTDAEDVNWRECKHCSKKFRTQSNLRQHIRQKHT